MKRSTRIQTQAEYGLFSSKRSKKAEESADVIIKFLLWIAVFVILAIAISIVAKKYIV